MLSISINDFFFVKALHWKRSNNKELKKFAMNTILEDLNHICLRVGGSSFEMKYVGSYGCTGNKLRVTTWEIGDRFVTLTQRFLQFFCISEIEKTNMKNFEELQTFKDEWNHHVMDPRLWIYGENFYELISFDEEDRHRTSYNRESEEYEEFGESEESGESDESEESEESMESDESEESGDSDESPVRGTALYFGYITGDESEESEESTESDESEIFFQLNPNSY
mgnify:CR=1 FL=1